MGKLEYSHLRNAGAVVENNKIPPLYLKELRCFGSAMKSHSRGTSGGVSKKPTAGKG